MKVFIIGAAGGIGNRLSSLLHARGDAVSGMHRNLEQASKITDTGATAVLGDLIHNSTEELAELFRGHDAIVFSAGAHGTGQENTTLIDGAGLRKAADAASVLTFHASSWSLRFRNPPAGRTPPRTLSTI